MEKKITENGISICVVAGTENYTPFHPAHRPRNTFYQYDYRHIDGELFSCVAPTLAECRNKRNGWLQNKKEKRQ